MITKKEVKYIQSLFQKKQRQETGLFVVEGPKILEELLQSKYAIKKIFVVEPKLLPPNLPITIDVQQITMDELTLISNLQTPNNVVMLVEQLETELVSTSKQLTVALDGIQDPGNFGTIIRIADWFGISNIVCNSDTVELYNPKVIQSTMGSFVRTNIMYTPLKEWLKQASTPIYGAMLEGKSIYQTPSIMEGILVIGNESKGIRPEIARLINQPITIPRMGGAESLNAAVAVGIILSHVWKK